MMEIHPRGDEASALDYLNDDTFFDTENIFFYLIIVSLSPSLSIAITWPPASRI